MDDAGTERPLGFWKKVEHNIDVRKKKTNVELKSV